MDLLYEADSQKQAFVDACAWADDIYLCLAWIEPGDAQGPGYADLKPHEGKVRQAIVGLARFQSYPALLRRLHRLSVLRLVTTVDGSFSPNCYVFRKGTRVRALIASAPFTSSRFSKPCESLVVFEGERDEPLALRALQLLERCRAVAHVPTALELDAYEDAWAIVRTGEKVPDAIAGVPLDTYDVAALGKLALEHEPTAVLDTFVAVRDAFSAAASMRVPALVVPRDPQQQAAPVRTTLFWSSLGMWGAVHRAAASYGLHFGFVSPWEMARPVAAVSLAAEHRPGTLAELAARGSTHTMVIARAEDGRRFLVHVLGDPRDYTADVEIADDSGAARAAIIGEVGSADFVQTAAAFARRASRYQTRPDPDAL